MTKLAFLGTSHAAQHLSRAAAEKGFELVKPARADVVFVSEDTPTDAEGRRDLDAIRRFISMARQCAAPIVLTSAVPPGFTRSLGFKLWHQSETLRIKDAEKRARHPEQIIIGGPSPVPPPSMPMLGLPDAYVEYLMAFACPVLRMTWEEAEFAKVAINCTLAAQVENTNRLAAAARAVDADWGRVAQALRLDGRIGPQSYLTPGRWQDSPHLLRDDVTLRELLK